MRNILKKITHPFLKFYYQRLEKKEHNYTYKHIKIRVFPYVFSPKLTISTKVLLDFLSSKNLQEKTFLELGAGCGIISFYAESKGGIVNASDISEYAIKGLLENKKDLNSSINITTSNLFEQITDTFDVIVINPPYYPKKANNIQEKAWFCGENFEYFNDLFNSLNKVIKKDTEVYMILSEDCELGKIKEIAKSNGYKLILEHTQTKFGEQNFIFKITNK